MPRSELEFNQADDNEFISESEHAARLGTPHVEKVVYNATTDPQLTDDASQGFANGSEWINIVTKRFFKCIDATINNALWLDFTPGGFGARIYPIMAGKDSKVSYSYLRGTGKVSTFKSPIILPVSCKLTAISAATEKPETWVVELHTGGSLITGALLNIVSDLTSYSTSYAALPVFTAGTSIQIYCNGNKVRKPLVYAWFEQSGV